MEFPTIPFVGMWPMNGVSVDSNGPILTGISPSAAVWSAVNRAIFVPVRIPFPITVRQMMVNIGAAGTATIDVGIYTTDGVRLVSKGSTTTVAGFMLLDVADTRVGSGIYYFAMSASTITTLTITGKALGTSQRSELYGLAQMEAAHPLPAMATLALTTHSHLPQIAANYREGTI